MRRARLFWIVAVLMILSLTIVGCMSKEEKESLIPEQVALLGSSTILISEVYYDTAGNDSVEEYIELYNMTSSSISVGGWTMTDNASTYTIPSGTSIPAKTAITIARNTSGFYALFGKNPTVSGMTLELGNSGDRITLKNGSTTIDFVAYENNVSGWGISATTGKSIARTSVTVDTDTASDWTSNVAPTPGSVPGGTPPAGLLKVHYIDVGQGDSILIQAPTGEAMLIDAGSYQIEYENKVLNYLAQAGVSSLTYVVATHPHSDHIGSLDAVVKKYPVGRALDSGYVYTSISYTDYMNALQSKNVPITNVRRGQVYNLSSTVRIEILSPTNTIVNAPANTNDVSIVLRVVYGSTSFILTGDAPQFVEQQIISDGYNVNSNALKVGHHGSYTSTAPAFVDAVTPTSGAVITCGEGNPYGHPHTETLNTLNAKNVRILRTDLDGGLNGNILMTSNGSSVTVQSYY